MTRTWIKAPEVTPAQSSISPTWKGMLRYSPSKKHQVLDLACLWSSNQVLAIRQPDPRQRSGLAKAWNRLQSRVTRRHQAPTIKRGCSSIQTTTRARVAKLCPRPFSSNYLCNRIDLEARNSIKGKSQAKRARNRAKKGRSMSPSKFLIRHPLLQITLIAIRVHPNKINCHLSHQPIWVIIMQLSHRHNRTRILIKTIIKAILWSKLPTL